MIGHSIIISIIIMEIMIGTLIVIPIIADILVGILLIGAIANIIPGMAIPGL